MKSWNARAVPQYLRRFSTNSVFHQVLSRNHSRTFTFSRRQKLKNADLSEESYWKQRYSDPKATDAFDWFGNGKTFVPLLAPTIKEHCDKWGFCRILDVGCGTSDLMHELNVAMNSATRNQDLNVHIYLLDYVRDALIFQQQRSSRYAQNASGNFHCYPVEFFVGDALRLPYRDCSFDFVIDKGTSDTLLKNMVAGTNKYRSFMLEVLRVLNEHGKYIQITDEDPDSRMTRIQGTMNDLCIDSDSASERFYFKSVNLSNGLDCFVYVVEK